MKEVGNTGVIACHSLFFWKLAEKEVCYSLE